MGMYTVAPAAKAGVNTANTVMWQLKSAAGTRLRIAEISIFVNVAPTTAPAFVLARSTATGTSSATATPIALDPADAAATAVLDTAWSAAPTFTTAGPFIDIAALPVTAGTGYVFTFPDPLVIAVSSGLVIANLNATGATLGSFVTRLKWEE